jgi:hypothetical protein
MVSREDTRRFKGALDELERAAGEPLVPGEVALWCESVTHGIEDTRKLRNAALDAHESSFAAILETNLEMGGRVDALRAGDAESTRELARIASEVAGSHDRCRARRSSEEPFDDVEQLRSDLLAWVAHARAHEKEVDHWLVEASLRDTGFAD